MTQYRRDRIIFLSILLHILVLLLWDGAARIGILATAPLPPPAPRKPIVFELQPPNQMPRQVVETPADAASKPPKRADFLSDKNSRARNPEKSNQLKEGDAFSRGDLTTHELPTPQLPRGETLKKASPKKAEKPTERDRSQPNREPVKLLKPNPLNPFGREYREWQEQQKRRGVQDLANVPHDQQLEHSLDMGGLSFNTYNWDFAPYMLNLKYRIKRNIFPPSAFTHLGMISGETLLKFRIYPDGRLEGPWILGYRGHKSLMETSKTAVEISAPFPRLPDDFPEPYLEITGKFQYFIRKRR